MHILHRQFFEGFVYIVRTGSFFVLAYYNLL
jgi:hypothetical protein